MASVNVPLPVEMGALRERVIAKVQEVFTQYPDLHGLDGLYEELSEAEYFVFYGHWLHQVVGKSKLLPSEEKRWNEYKEKMLHVEKVSDKILAGKGAVNYFEVCA